MFTAARRDLIELVTLTKKIASYDATLAARNDIQPTDSAGDRRNDWERRQVKLMDKYELLGRQ